MRVLVSIICLCMLCVCLSSLTAVSLSLTDPIAPTLDISCSLKGKSVGRRPPESVIFAWRVTNAQYVLIKGYDQERHPLIGEFSRPTGGIYTFIAVNGNEIVRKPCMCVLKSGPGLGPYQWTIEDNEGGFSLRTEGSDIELTTPLSRDHLKDLLINLARTNYGVVLEPSDAAKENIFLVTKSYGVHESLCQVDGCKKDGSQLIRQLGFDIVAQRDFQIGDKTRYKIHITGEVLSKPASGDGQWGVDSNSKEIAALMSKKLAEDIINHDKQQ